MSPLLISNRGVSAIYTYPSRIRVGVSRYSMVRISVRIWKPSTSPSVQMTTLLHRRLPKSKGATFFTCLFWTSTPQPRTLMRSVMISLLKIRA